MGFKTYTGCRQPYKSPEERMAGLEVTPDMEREEKARRALVNLLYDWRKEFDLSPSEFVFLVSESLMQTGRSCVSTERRQKRELNTTDPTDVPPVTGGK